MGGSIYDAVVDTDYVYIASDGLLISGYRGPGKSLAQPTSRCILFDGENISLMLVLLCV